MSMVGFFIYIVSIFDFLSFNVIYFQLNLSQLVQPRGKTNVPHNTFAVAFAVASSAAFAQNAEYFDPGLMPAPSGLKSLVADNRMSQ